MKNCSSKKYGSVELRVFAAVLALLLLLTGCAASEKGSGNGITEPVQQGEPAPGADVQEQTEEGAEEMDDRVFYAHVNGNVLTVAAEDNTSADAFLQLLKAGDVTVEMSDYGSFEKVGPLGTSLPTNDERITTEPGDVILYQGDQITIYYDENTWSFTRLGKVRNLTAEELRDALGRGDVTVTFSLNPDGQEKAEGSVLVVVFSRTGHTRPLAGYIADELGGDLYEIQAEVPYTDDDIKYYTDCRADREQKDPDVRPGIAGELPDASGYDTVFLGYPIWHGQAPRIISTFLDGVDLSGKKVIPFCTSGSSPLGSSAEDLHSLAPGAEWDEGRRFAIGTSREEILQWLDSLGFSSETE